MRRDDRDDMAQRLRRSYLFMALVMVLFVAGEWIVTGHVREVVAPSWVIAISLINGWPRRGGS